MSRHRLFGRSLILLLLLSLSLSLIPVHAQQKASFQQEVEVTSFGLTKIDMKISYFNNGSAFIAGPLDLRFPGYGPLILNSTVPYSVEGDDLILHIPAFEVPAHSEKSYSMTLWFFPFFTYAQGMYRVNFTLAPAGIEVRQINCTIQLPRGAKTELSPLGFTEMAPNSWLYFRTGNISTPAVVEIFHSPTSPYMFANIEILDMNRRYLYGEDGKALVEDELWIKLYDDGVMLSSVKVADYINGRIQVEVGESDLEYERVAEGALPLPFPLQKGITYLKLRYYMKGTDSGQAVLVEQSAEPPIIAFVRHASVYLNDELIGEVAQTTSLPKTEVTVPKAGPPVATYVGAAVLAIIFLGLLLLFARTKEVTHELIKKKKAVIMKYLELYEAMINGLLTKEEFAKQRRELESEKAKVSKEISSKREKLVKDKKKKEADQLLKSNRELEDILKKARPLLDLGKKKKKKALEEIKRLMKELEAVK